MSLLKPWQVWGVLLSVSWFAYFPGLSGPFLFDDYPNLSPLGFYGGVKDWDTILSYVFGGFSGPTGRPVSLLTFLVNANDWPADPYSFKATNVLIHLFCATLVFLISHRILAIVLDPKTDGNYKNLGWIALVCAGFWLLHPYLVSTTLYVVQRMAMLAALFSFAGIYCYLYGRSIISEHPKKAFLWMSGAVIFGTILATFSKENGAVLPLLLLVLESTLLSSKAVTFRWFKVWKTFFLILPSLLVLAYLVKSPLDHGFFLVFENRDFSPYERLLTEARVVFTYLQSWLVPSFSGGRLFYDHIEVSRSLLMPATTLLSVIALTLSVIVAIIFRKKAPLWVFAYLFFLVSQVIESTTIGLEIKFDHRIYLGSAFLILPFLSLAARVLSVRLSRVAACVVLTVLSVATYSSATLWGDYRKLAMVWALQTPESVRAQTEVAQMLFNEGRVSESLATLNQAATINPDSFRLRLTQVLVQCRYEGANEGDLKAVLFLSKDGPYRHTDFGLLESFFTGASDEGCKGISLDFFNEVVTNLLESSKIQRPDALVYAQLHYYLGLGLLRERKIDEALEVLEKAHNSRSSLHMRMMVAATKASAGLYALSLKDAQFVAERLESGEIVGRAAVEAPELEDVYHFIRVVEEDLAAQEEKGE